MSLEQQIGIQLLMLVVIWAISWRITDAKKEILEAIKELKELLKATTDEPDQETQ